MEKEGIRLELKYIPFSQPAHRIPNSEIVASYTSRNECDSTYLYKEVSMIDTLGVNFFNISIPPSELTSWDYHKIAKKYSYYRKIVYPINDSCIQLDYYPKNQFLRMEFSLPNLVYGNNIQQLFDISGALDNANKAIDKIPELPKIDLWDGVLFRLDVYYNHNLEQLVPYFIKALKFLDMPRRETLPYPSGVVFKNGQKATKFYDKELERLANNDKSGALSAQGILRQEITFRKKALIAILGKKKPTLRDISIDLLLDILENDLQELGVFGSSIGTRTTIAEKLCDEYGPLAGVYYVGILVLKIEVPNEEIVCSLIQKHPRTLDRQLKKILDASVPLTFTDTDEPLPPLVIDRSLIKKLAGP
jgi:hypothetical protein